jgi:hypothetical protein
MTGRQTLNLLASYSSGYQIECFKVTENSQNVAERIVEPQRGKTPQNSPRSKASSAMLVIQCLAVRRVKSLRGLEACDLVTAATVGLASDLYTRHFDRHTAVLQRFWIEAYHSAKFNTHHHFNTEIQCVCNLSYGYEYRVVSRLEL